MRTCDCAAHALPGQVVLPPTAEFMVDLTAEIDLFENIGRMKIEQLG
jgi:hypothetical protein